MILFTEYGMEQHEAIRTIHLVTRRQGQFLVAFVPGSGMCDLNSTPIPSEQVDALTAAVNEWFAQPETNFSIPLWLAQNRQPPFGDSP